MDVAHLARLLAFLSAPAEQTTSASLCRQQKLNGVTSSLRSDVASLSAPRLQLEPSLLCEYLHSGKIWD